LAFNAEWQADIAKLQSQGIDVIGVDTNALFASILADPALYGFTNVTASAQGLTGVNPDQYLFWDDLHPTTAADTLIAETALADFENAPEPATLAVVFLGLGALVTLRAAKARRSNGPA
jgi:phospholipase/lecithinase/hemolysin